jgi:glycosyltransferase involved in cell wall biosynthesis
MAALDRVEADASVILVENGSTDATAAVAAGLAASDPRITVLRLATPDYGAAMRAGFLAARGEWVANVDIDYFSGEFLTAALDLAGGADVILASKRAPGAVDRRGRVRRLGTFTFNVLLRVLLRSRVSDTHGMKVIRLTVVAALAPAVISTKDLFDTELVIRAERAGFRIKEIPAVVEELRAARSSLLKRVPRTVRGLLRIRRTLRREAAKAQGASR